MDDRRQQEKRARIAERERRLAELSGQRAPFSLGGFNFDRRLLVPGIILIVFLVLWLFGSHNFPLGRMLNVGLRSILG